MSQQTGGVVTVALVGCGYWGPNLLRSFSSLSKECRVKWVVEKSEDRRRYVEENFPFTKTRDNLETILADPEVQACVIATPAATHFSIARQCLEAGKHCLVEKPMAMTEGEVDELSGIATGKGLTLMVGHTFLFNPAVRYLRDYVQSGKLGRVYYAYAQRLNLGVVRSDLNAMWNLAPHDISILQYVLDRRPTAVSAVGKAYLQEGIEDVVFMDVHYDGGVIANIHVSWLDPSKIRKITLVGSETMVVYDDMADAKITIYQKGAEVHQKGKAMAFDLTPASVVDYRNGDIWMPQIKWQEPLKLESMHFLSCIRGESKPLTSAENAKDVVATLSAAEVSLRTGSAAAPIRWKDASPS